MKIEMEITKKKGNIDGKEVEYYVLRKELITGDIVDIPVKKDRAQILAMNEKMIKK